MGKHIVSDNITDGINARNACLKIFIDLDKTLIHCNANLVKPQTFGVGGSTNSNQNKINLLLLIAKCDQFFSFFLFNLAHRDTGMNFNPIFLNHPCKSLGNLSIFVGQNLRKHFNNRYIHIHPLHNLCKLHSNYTAADNKDTAREFIKVERTV